MKPESEPTKILPSTIVGSLYAEDAAGNPKAHFSCSRATEAAEILPDLAGWKRVFVKSGLHPFQPGEDVRSLIRALLAQRVVLALTAPRSPPRALGPARR